VELVVQSADRDREGVIKILRQGFDLVYGKTTNAAVQQRLYDRNYLMRSLFSTLDRLTDKWGTDYNRWKKILGEKTFTLIAQEANSDKSHIRNLARTFSAKLKKDKPRLVAGKGLESILKKNAPVDTLKKRPEVTPPISIKVNVKTDIVPKDLSGKKKQVVAMAMALKEKNIPFGWGGKNPQKGLDSSGFIAYIFHQAGLLDKPEKWWSRKLREEMGTPRNTKKPEQVGDLLFYADGYVMLYLGNNNIIGMTRRGIIIQHYREFYLKLIQVNRVDYD
jgi:cell wall-associated NlpC family hydrolase